MIKLFLEIYHVRIIKTCMLIPTFIHDGIVIKHFLSVQYSDSTLNLEDSQTTLEMETRPPKTLTSDPNMLPGDDAQSSKPVGGVKTINNIIYNVHFQQMEDNQTTIELPPEADKESTNLPEDDAENPVGGIIDVQQYK